MPIIQIKSLPFETEPDVCGMIEATMQDFSRDTGVSLENLSITWEYIPAGHYGVAGQAAWNQPRESHPMLVELITPDLHSADEISTYLEQLGAILAERVGVPVENIFITHRAVKSGTVLDGGSIRRW